MYFLLKEFTSVLKNFFRDFEIDLTKRDMLRHIERGNFNPSIRYPKYLKRSLVDYNERIDNYTKFNRVGAKISEDYRKISLVRYGIAKISQV